MTVTFKPKTEKVQTAAPAQGRAKGSRIPRRDRCVVDLEPGDCLMTTPQAEDFLGRGRNSLATYRCRGIGPKFIKFENGDVRYRQSDLIAWDNRTVSAVEEAAQNRTKREKLGATL